MKYSLLQKDLNDIDTDAINILIFEDDIKDKKINYQILSEVNEISDSLVEALIEKEKITGKFKNTTSFYNGKKRYSIIGLGKKEEIKSSKIIDLAGLMCSLSIKEKDSSVFVYMRTEDDNHYLKLSEGFQVGSYTFLEYISKEKKKEKKVKLSEIQVYGKKEHKESIEKGKAIGKARNFARDLINHPRNYMTPDILAKTIKKHLKELDVKILSKAEIKELKMGGLLGVASGSKDEPKFVIIRHNPEKKKSKVKIVLVGKGVTFDSGGISIKPSLNMHEMKGDMAGAATVAGIMDFVKAENIPYEVVGLIPSASNMPGNEAITPGDILTALNGKTVEVLNTDAEGRLLLMDALSYAVKHEKADYIVDFATLTGAMVVALGDITTGIFTNTDELADDIVKASDKSGEYLWKMPMFEEYRKQLDSDIADIKNIGGRKAGSITAAKFLEEFVDKTPWAHLDIAGTSWIDSHDYLKPSGTGATISTLAQWLMDFNK